MAVGTLSISGTNKLRAYIQDSASAAALLRTFGDDSWPALSLGLEFGSATGLANKAVITRRTVAATTYDNLDLSGSLVDGLGNTTSFTFLKLAIVALVSPDGTKKVRVGPQNQSNAWQGPWGGVGATVYREVPYWDVVVWEPVAGYAVTNASTDIFPVYNPTGSSLDYVVLLAGI